MFVVGNSIADDGLAVCRCGEEIFMVVRGGLPPGDNEYLGISNVEKCKSVADSVTPRICFIVVDLSCRNAHKNGVHVKVTANVCYFERGKFKLLT